jgi:hypothetical protein
VRWGEVQWSSRSCPCSPSACPHPCLAAPVLVPDAPVPSHICTCTGHPVPVNPIPMYPCRCCALVSVAPRPSPLVFMSVLVRTDCVSLMLMVVPAIMPALFQSRSGPCLHPVPVPCLFPHLVLLACALFGSWPILTHLPALGCPGPGPDLPTLVHIRSWLTILVHSCWHSLYCAITQSCLPLYICYTLLISRK